MTTRNEITELPFQSEAEEFRYLQEKRDDLERVCEVAISIDGYITNLPGDRTRVLSSIFFTIINFVLLQLRRMLSGDKFRAIANRDKDFAVNDSISPAVLLRCLLESYLNFYYLCIEPVDHQIRDIRMMHWDWHEYNDRIRGLGENKRYEKYRKEFEKRRASIKDKIRQLPAYESMHEKWRKSLFVDGRPICKPKAQIAQSAGISVKIYRQLYLYLSTSAHCSPLPICNLSDARLYKAAQIKLLSDCADYAVMFGCFAVRDIIRLFPDARLKIHKRVYDLISIREGQMAAD